MKLLGRDIDAKELWEKVEARLQARGLLEAPSRPISLDGPEPFVDPLSFHLTALEAHADPTRPLPAEGSRAGAIARGVIGLAFRPVMRELFARQHLFNAHVRDAFAQLSAEVIALKQERGRPERSPRPSAKPRSSEVIVRKDQAPTAKPPPAERKPRAAGTTALEEPTPTATRARTGTKPKSAKATALEVQGPSDRPPRSGPKPRPRSGTQKKRTR